MHRPTARKNGNGVQVSVRTDDARLGEADSGGADDAAEDASTPAAAAQVGTNMAIANPLPTTTLTPTPGTAHALGTGLDRRAVAVRTGLCSRLPIQWPRRSTRVLWSLTVPVPVPVWFVVCGLWFMVCGLPLVCQQAPILVPPPNEVVMRSKGNRFATRQSSTTSSSSTVSAPRSRPLSVRYPSEDGEHTCTVCRRRFVHAILRRAHAERVQRCCRRNAHRHCGRPVTSCEMYCCFVAGGGNRAARGGAGRPAPWRRHKRRAP